MKKEKYQDLDLINKEAIKNEQIGWILTIVTPFVVVSFISCIVLTVSYIL